jgi:hypothetical protein
VGVSNLVKASQVTPAAVGCVVASAPVTTTQTYTVSAAPEVAQEEIEIVEPALQVPVCSAPALISNDGLEPITTF